MNINSTILKSARQAIEFGWSLVTTKPNSKVTTGVWKHRQQTRASFAELLEDLLDGCGIAVVNGEVSNHAVLDFDSRILAREFMKTHRELCRVMAISRRGIHIHFKTSIPVKTQHLDKLDVLGTGSLCMLPPSIANNHQYRWIKGYEPENGFPEFPYDLFPEPPEYRPQMPVVTSFDRQHLIGRAEKYLACMEPAISGSNGHSTLFRSAAVLIQKFELTVTEALPLLLNYNERCEPPFQPKEVERKLNEVLKLRS